ncbi:MAG: hypothetical protein U0269_36455 [Polyangiales bacterium]
MIVALFASALCAARPSLAEERAQLASYQRAGEASACPDEAAFRQLVRDRVGREPFDPEAARSVSVALSRRAGWYSLALELDGATRSVRARRCSDAVEAAALTVAIALDPELAFGPARAAIPRGAASSDAPSETPPALPPGFRETPENLPVISDSERAPAVVLWDPAWRPPAPHELRALELSFAMGARVGLAPGVGSSLARPSFVWGLGARVGAWLFALEASADLPGRASDSPRSAVIDAVVLSSSGSACRFAQWPIAPFVCARATIGAVGAWGSGYAINGAAWLPIVLGGARAGVDFSLSRRWALRLAVDGDLAIVRPALVIEGAAASGRATVFESPLAAMGAWIGARMWL